MPHIWIDGQRIEAAEGKTIIQAAYENNIEIPHFCWHPELSVAGNCRMCLVEVGLPKRLPSGGFEEDANGNMIISYMPKLQIACGTTISEGMHVNVTNEKSVKAQEVVMEFLLINHPLDCPICDEAGECKLQDYAFRHSNGDSRFIEEKNHKDKRQPWGPNVLYDAERCISCSRCIRYAKETAKQDVLTFVKRGDHVTIKLFDGTSWDNDYSMNVIEICPVGALTSPDFRFKSRVWDMSFNDSVCSGCARGCNNRIGVRNNEILRIQPRTNPYVNKYWLCDHGRLDLFPKVNNDRILQPLLKDGKEHKPVEWKEAITRAASILKSYRPAQIMVVGSAKSTCEDNYILKRFAEKTLGTKNVDFFSHIDEKFGDDFLKVSDVTPNSIGAMAVGINPGADGISYKKLAEKISEGAIKVLYIMNEDFNGYHEILKVLHKLEAIIVHASNHNEITKIADVVFADSTFAEIEGTYVNVNRRVQHFGPALTTKENLRIMGMKMSRLDMFGAENDSWSHGETRNCKQSWRAIQMLANAMGSNQNFKNSEEVFDDMAQHISLFSKMSYDKLDEFLGLELGRGDNPDKKVVLYQSHVLKPE